VIYTRKVSLGKSYLLKTSDQTTLMRNLLAGDTTSTTIAVLIYNVLKHPHVENKLAQELREAELSQLPSVSEVNKLPYLNAVIKESMRVFPTPM